MLRKRPLVVIVDDDEMVCEATAALVETFGLAVRTFASGEALLQSGCVPQSTCLVADVQMPSIGGVELYRLITESGHHIPVVFITAVADAEARSRALAEGAIGYLNKPFEPTQLLKCLRVAIGHWEGEPRI